MVLESVQVYPPKIASKCTVDKHCKGVKCMGQGLDITIERNVQGTDITSERNVQGMDITSERNVQGTDSYTII